MATLNQASRQLDEALLAAVNGSGLPLRMVELQLLNLLHAVQDRLHQEETEETMRGLITLLEKGTENPSGSLNFLLTL